MANEQSASSSAVPTPARGILPYALGFLAFIPAPVISVIIAGIVMVAVFPAQNKKGGIVAENSRRAANWGLTIIAAMLLILASLAVLGLIFPGRRGFFPMGIPILLYVIFAVTHVSVCIMGIIKAHAGEAFDNRLAIPFLKADRPQR